MIVWMRSDANKLSYLESVSDEKYEIVFGFHVEYIDAGKWIDGIAVIIIIEE